MNLINFYQFGQALLPTQLHPYLRTQESYDIVHQHQSTHQGVFLHQGGYPHII